MPELRSTLTTALHKLGVERAGTADRLRGRVRALKKRNAKLVERLERVRKRKEALQRQLDGMQGASITTAVPADPDVSRLELRRQCALVAARASPSILEIGPAHNGIFPKREGYRTKTVDYLDRKGLIERYKDFAHYSPDDIEDVDFVLAPGAAMVDVISEQFDLVVASHVIEHTTSMIDFLNECTRLLAPGGTLALVVPDHRYCFDRFRERASLGRVIDASLAPPAVHTPGTVIEERINAVKHRGTTAWEPGHHGRYTFAHDVSAAKASGEEARRADRYIDTHNWICTPNHLRLLLDDLYALGFISLREQSFHDTVKHEFFLNLSVGAPGPGLTRAQLTTLADNERRSLDAAVFQDQG